MISLNCENSTLLFNPCVSQLVNCLIIQLWYAVAKVESERILRKHANIVYAFKLENNNKDLETERKR